MSKPRIVSLLPSATEIVYALGLGHLQVGRSHECDFPAAVWQLPACTRPLFDVEGSSREIDTLVKQRLATAASVYAVDNDLLRELQPTHVITQTLCDVCAVSFQDVQAAFASEQQADVKLVPLSAGSLEGLWQDIASVAQALDVAQTAAKLVSTLKLDMSTIAARASESAIRPRVAAIEWIDPLMAAGNWVPELIEMANGVNLFGSAGKHSPWMSWDDLFASLPDVIVAMPCGFDLDRTRREMGTLVNHPQWRSLPAVQSNKVFLCDGNQFFNRPGPRLRESLQILAEILHPQLFAPTLENIGWQRMDS